MQEALELELSVLEALLRRNQPSHGRTLYHQRLSMVLRCAVQRHKCGVMEVASRIRGVEHRVMNEYRAKKQRKHEEWTLEDLLLQPAGEEDLVATELRKEWQELYRVVTRGLPELLSRIDHAASALYIEVARGFFLPFCTVALGAIGRIRAIAMRLGREWLGKLLDLASSNELVFCECQIAQGEWEETMRSFVEPTEEKTTIGRQDDQFWNLLGLSRSLVDSHPHTTVDPKASDGTLPLKKETPSAAEQVEIAVMSHELDVGESVDLQEAGELLKLEEWKSSDGSQLGNDVDHNAQVLASLQKSSEKPAKRRRGGDVDEGSGELSYKNDKIRKKKRKKSTKKKIVNNIIDEIFGG